MCAVIRYVTVYYILHKVELPFVYTYKKTKPWMNFPGLDFVRTLFKFKTRKENLSSFVQSRPLENVVSGIFHVQVVQLWSKKCTKKRKTGRMSVNLSPPPPHPQYIHKQFSQYWCLFPTHRTCLLFMKTVYVWRMISCSARVWRLRWVSPVIFNVGTGLSTWRVLPLFTLWINLNLADSLLRSKCGSRDLNVLFFLEYHSFAGLLGTAFIYVT